MTVSIIASGVDQSFSTHLNANFNFTSTQALIARMNTSLTATTGFTSDRNYLFDNVLGETTTGYVDTAGTTCLYSETGLVAFCDVLDLFDDASISTAIWVTSTSGDRFTLTEGSGYIQVGCDAENSGTSSAGIISSGASGLNLGGQNGEVIMDITTVLADSNSGSGGGSFNASIQVQLSDGGTHVNLWGDSGEVTRTTNTFLRIVYDHSNNRCDVFTINRDTGVETLYANNTSVASLGANRYIRIFGTGTAGTSSSSTAYAQVRAIGYRKHGAGAGDAVFESLVNTVESSDRGLSYAQFITNPSSQTHNITMNSGTNYSSDSFMTWATTTAGTGAQLKITVPKPTTITADTANIPVLLRWGMLYD